MTSIESSALTNRGGALRDMLVMPFLPRTTMARVLTRPRDRYAVPLFLLGLVSAAIADQPTSELGPFVALDWSLQAMVAGVVILVFLVLTGLFYAYSYLLAGVTRLLEGVADPSGLRAALAWAGIPSIGALVYRVPAALLLAWEAETIRLTDSITIIGGAQPESCAAALILGLLEVAVLIWTIVLVVINVSVAAGFSIGRSLAALVITMLAPVALLIVSLPLFA